MYNDMYSTFDNVKFTYDYPYSFEKRNQPYLEMIDKADDSWEYGEKKTIKIPIKIKLNDNEYLLLSLYNFRYENELCIESKIIENEEVIFVLNEEDSELLLPNIYYYTLEVVKSNNNEYIITIQDEHFFYVKDELC